MLCLYMSPHQEDEVANYIGMSGMKYVCRTTLKVLCTATQIGPMLCWLEEEMDHTPKLVYHIL